MAEITNADRITAKVIFGLEGTAYDVETIAQTLADIRAEGYRAGVEAAAKAIAPSTFSFEYCGLVDKIRALAETGGKE